MGRPVVPRDMKIQKNVLDVISKGSPLGRSPAGRDRRGEGPRRSAGGHRAVLEEEVAARRRPRRGQEVSRAIEVRHNT